MPADPDLPVFLRPCQQRAHAEEMPRVAESQQSGTQCKPFGRQTVCIWEKRLRRQVQPQMSVAPMRDVVEGTCTVQSSREQNLFLHTRSCRSFSDDARVVPCHVTADTCQSLLSMLDVMQRSFLLHRQVAASSPYQDHVGHSDQLRYLRGSCRPQRRPGSPGSEPRPSG